MFLVAESNDGNVPHYQMKFTLNNDVLLQASYNSIPRTLWKKLKN